MKGRASAGLVVKNRNINSQIIRLAVIATLIIISVLAVCLGQSESEDTMGYIPKIKVGSTTYDVKDAEAREEISSLEAATKLVNDLLDFASDITNQQDEIIQGKLYNITSGQLQAISNTTTRKFTVNNNVLAYYVTTQIFAGTADFPVITYFNSSDEVIGYEYLKAGTTSLAKRILCIPAGASYFYVGSRNFTSIVYAVTPDDVTDMGIHNMLDLAYRKASLLTNYIDPGSDAEYTLISGRGLYNIVTGEISQISNATVKKVIIDQTVKEYLITSSVYAGSNGYALITYFDSNNAVVGYEYMCPASGNISIEKSPIKIPAGAVYFYINARNAASVIKAVKSDSAIEKQAKRPISILFVGNSMTQDAVSYVPYLLYHYFPEVDFRFYMWYVGGKTLGQHYEYFTANTPCEIFSVAENQPYWGNAGSGNAPTMQAILTTKQFDIVCLQEYFNYKDSYAVADLADWNNCKNYIQSNYTGGNPLKFISLMHAPRTNALETVWPLDKSGNALILQQTIAEDMIPAGIAKYNGLSSSIGTLGDGNDLTVGDYTHAQEGLPSLLQAYTTVCWILDKLSISKSVYDCTLRMSTAIYETINVPGPNLGTGVITGTDAQNLTAQEVAIMAFKEGKAFVNKNIFAEPEQ